MSNTSEAIPYKTTARRETHPARMGALAQLSGIAAASANACSVLELGCGDGRNILPMAALNPGSRYVGVDLSRALIDKGRRECEELGLVNVELICANIAEYSPTAASFDYVICHGLYSWVSQELQGRILSLVKKALAPCGVAFVSYNTLPGWRQRGVLRDIIRVGALASEGGSERERCQAGLALLKAVAQEPNLSAYVRESVARLEHSDPSYISQEFLGEYNTPLLFIDFMRDAQEQGLQYLSESRVVMMSTDDLSPQTRQLLDSFGEDVWMQEQVLDIIRNRTFRETLLCHDNLVLNRGLSTKVFKDLVFVSNYLACDGDEDVQQNQQQGLRFRERQSGREICAPIGECQRVLSAAARLGARGATIAELARSIEEDISEHELMRAVVTLWKSGFIEALQFPIAGLSSAPVISQLARLQAYAGERVTSALHESLELSALERRVVELATVVHSFQALEVLLVQSAPLEKVTAAINSLRIKGFFQ